MESHRRGDLTEAIVIAELKRQGIPVATPFGDNERYDAVLESRSGDLYRVQIKTGWIENGAIQFRGYSQHTNGSGNTRKHYGDEIDFFLVYSPDTESIYLVDQGQVNDQLRLRVEEPEQSDPTINWAEEYRFDEQWPPKVADTGGPPVAVSGTVEAVTAFLEARDVTVAKRIDDGRSGDLLAETPSGEYVLLRARSGSVTGGRIRHPPDDGDEAPDYLAIYYAERDELYLVPGDHYGSSISLRIQEPQRDREDVNRAENYEFDVRWPPGSDEDPPA